MTISSAMRRFGRKLTQGMATAGLFVGTGYLAVSFFNWLSGWGWRGFDIGSATRVGLPALLGGMVFFPVGKQSVASRSRFALRSAFGGLVFALGHRLLYWAPGTRGGFGNDAFSEEPVQTLLDLANFLREPHLSVLGLHPGEGLLAGGPLLFEVLSVAFAVIVGAAIQPHLLVAATGNRLQEADANKDAAVDRVPVSDVGSATRHRVR